MRGGLLPLWVRPAPALAPGRVLALVCFTPGCALALILFAARHALAPVLARGRALALVLPAAPAAVLAAPCPLPQQASSRCSRLCPPCPRPCCPRPSSRPSGPTCRTTCREAPCRCRSRPSGQPRTRSLSLQNNQRCNAVQTWGDSCMIALDKQARAERYYTWCDTPVTCMHAKGCMPNTVHTVQSCKKEPQNCSTNLLQIARGSLPSELCSQTELSGHA
jgi:hypothetical protein